MSIAKSYSAQLTGLKLETVSVEVDISNGLHSFSIVGLGDRAVEESKDRVSAAIKNSGFVSPRQKNQKVIVSLAPADIRKEGPSFDLAIAMAYLAATGDIVLAHDRKLFLGELSLEGGLRRISGILPMLCQAVDRGFTSAFIPKENAEEASLARNIRVFAASSLREVIDHIMDKSVIEPLTEMDAAIKPREVNMNSYEHDFDAIRGNDAAKRGLEIAVAGAHNLMMCGPPGTGKTMLARGIRAIIPPLSYEHSMEVTGIHSSARILTDRLIVEPPFRSPHHTASYPAIVGGGNVPKPGEITLAHRGILFLDEFPEFDRSVIEALRQPLEEREITISRARGSVTFPAQCMLIASMNPCPCGLGKDNGCICQEKAYNAYRRKISGPILDRIDIWVNVDKIDYEKLASRNCSPQASSKIRDRVIAARKRQSARFIANGLGISYNSEISAKDIDRCVQLSDGARQTLKLSAEKLQLSGRAFHRVIKVGQTIADLANADEITKEFVLEALQYRQQF